MHKIAAVLAAGAAALTLIGAPAAHADPTPDPTPGYTWECDTNDFGHRSCSAVPEPECGLVKGWVVQLPPGTFEQPSLPKVQGQVVLPAPCTGGPPNFPRAPYPTRSPAQRRPSGSHRATATGTEVESMENVQTMKDKAGRLTAHTKKRIAIRRDDGPSWENGIAI